MLIQCFEFGRLSGLSPFMGDSDVDTFANITRADYDFDDEAFDTVTQSAKDFISSLLVHRKEDRLSAKQCLESMWLSQHNDDSPSKIRICTDKLKKFIIRRKWQVCISKQHYHFMCACIFASINGVSVCVCELRSMNFIKIQWLIFVLTINLLTSYRSKFTLTK